MMAPLPRAAAPTVPKVWAKVGAGARAPSQAWRPQTSANTASSWKWVPTTAQMWNSWWLCPAKRWGGQHQPLARCPTAPGITPHLTDVVKAPGCQALWQVGGEEEAGEEGEEEVVAVAGHSLGPGAVIPEAEQELAGERAGGSVVRGRRGRGALGQGLWGGVRLGSVAV